MKRFYSIKISFLFLGIWNGVPQVADWLNIVGVEMPSSYTFGNGASEVVHRPPAKPVRP